MRAYEVQPGDSPGSISANFAGCPKCARDLVRANRHKASVIHPNGFETFKELLAGEKLNLPDKWFNGDLESRPDMYFAALPYPDGVTPSSLGTLAAGVLGDYAALDAAAAMVSALSAMGDQQFNASVDAATAQINAAISEALSSTNQGAVGYAQKVRSNTDWLKMRNRDLAEIIAAGDQSAGVGVREDMLNTFAAALADARIALSMVYSGPPTPAPSGGISSAVLSAAQAAANAIASDPNYCASVARTGSAVNSAVHAFKGAWNSSGLPAVPINTGNYEQPTADAIARALGSAPAACAPRAGAPPSPPRPSTPQIVTPTTEKKELSTAAIAGIALLGASAVGGAVYLVTARRRGRRRRRGARR